jgi:hypothetical protein
LSSEDEPEAPVLEESELAESEPDETEPDESEPDEAEGFSDVEAAGLPSSFFFDSVAALPDLP